MAERGQLRLTDTTIKFLWVFACYPVHMVYNLPTTSVLFGLWKGSEALP